MARDRHRVIAINSSWLLCPWAEMLYACDYAWWQRHGGVPEFRGLKVSGDRAVLRQPWGVERITIDKATDRLILDRPGVVGWGGNSGFHAINLAAQLQVARIILVGFDMRVDLGIHWHGKHDRLHNPTARNVARWRRAIDATAGDLAAAGVEMINANELSALEAFPKMSLAEAIC